MIEKGKTYLVMGLLDRESIAYIVGQTIERLGGKVIYSIQNDVLKRRYLDGSKSKPETGTPPLDYRYCDVSKEEEVVKLFSELGPLAGVVHSIAYANPKTCLGAELHTSAVEDIKRSYEISCVSLATVTRCALPALAGGGSIVALSFDAQRAYALYNWMGVHKAALEALVRALARRHGRDNVRVNAVSAGPLATTAATRIPDFERIYDIWQASSPLPWDAVADKQAVADAVAFLISPMAAKITGQILHVDGGVSAVGGTLLDYERP